MRTERNAEGIAYLVEPLSPQEQLDVLVPGTALVVAIPIDLPRDTEGFYDALNAAVLGWPGWYLQVNGYERVGWADRDTALYEIDCFAEEDDVYRKAPEGTLPPREEG